MRMQGRMQAMSSHLTRRGAVYTFQFRVPSDLVTLFGQSPFWLRLGRIEAADAARAARILAGQVEAAFLAARGGRRMDRKDVTSALEEIGSALKDVKSRQLRALFRSSTSPWIADADYEESDERFRELMAQVPERVRIAQAEANVLGSVADRLSRIKSTAEREAAEASDADAQAAKLADAVAQRLRPLVGAGAQQAAVEPKAAKPNLSVLFETAIGQREEAKGSKEGYTRRMRNAGQRFVEIVGDKAYDQYVPHDIQCFVNVLARVPRTWDKMTGASDKTFQELADLNGASDKPQTTFSEESIRDYVRCLKNLWTRSTSHLTDAPNLPGAKYDMPVAAQPSIVREGLTATAISKWFAISAQAERADDRWLPLLGMLTGARLGELVGLTAEDLQDRDGRLVFNLSRRFVDVRVEADDEDVEVEARAPGTDDATGPRSFKNAHSRRLVTIHNFLKECGFVSWARRQTGFLFPALHRTSAPSRNASKRMKAQMVAAGIHVPHQDVFHSLRHTHKDWLEDEGVPEKTRDRQVGHAPSTVGRRYGKKSLRSKEIDLIATAALPEGVDFGPYLRPAEKTRVPKRRKRLLTPRLQRSV